MRGTVYLHTASRPADVMARLHPGEELSTRDIYGDSFDSFLVTDRRFDPNAIGPAASVEFVIHSHAGIDLTRLTGRADHRTVFTPETRLRVAAVMHDAWLGPANTKGTRVFLTESPHPSAEHVPQAAPLIDPSSLSPVQRQILHDHTESVAAGVWYRDQNHVPDMRLEAGVRSLAPIEGAQAILGHGTAGSLHVGPNTLSVRQELGPMLMADRRLGDDSAAYLFVSCSIGADEGAFQVLANQTDRVVIAADRDVWIGGHPNRLKVHTKITLANGRERFEYGHWRIFVPESADVPQQVGTAHLIGEHDAPLSAEALGLRPDGRAFADWGDRAPAIRDTLPPLNVPYGEHLREIMAGRERDMPADPATRAWLAQVTEFEHPATGLRVVLGEVHYGPQTFSFNAALTDHAGHPVGRSAWDVAHGRDGELIARTLFRLDEGLGQAGREFGLEVNRRVENWLIGQRVDRVLTVLDTDLPAWQEGTSFLNESDHLTVQDRVERFAAEGRLSPEGAAAWERIKDTRFTPRDIIGLGSGSPRPGHDGLPTWDGKEILTGRDFNLRTLEKRLTPPVHDPAGRPEETPADTIGPSGDRGDAPSPPYHPGDGEHRMGPDPVPGDPHPDPPIRTIGATGDAADSPIRASEERIAEWDRLSAGELDARIAEIKSWQNGLVTAKLVEVQRILAAAGEQPSHVTTIDSKNLRVYANQRGELFIHGAALLVDPGTTIEVAYQPSRTFNSYRYEAHASYLANLDAVPKGMTTDQANALAAWHGMRGDLKGGRDWHTLEDDLVDMHAQPLRDALAIRERLIHDYGVSPERVVVVHDRLGRWGHYRQSRWVRATILALDRIRATPVEARQAIVDAIRGPGESGEARARRATSVADRLYARHEDGSARGYTLLWVRDSRMEVVGGRHGPQLDTRPEFIRQTIETLRELHPDRQIVLVGDDLFARRPELRAAWARDGVLHGVDTDSLVNFWDAGRNGGRALSYGEQALFFHLLNTDRDVLQIGMESGSLELQALLGMPTVYLEATEFIGNKGNRWELYWSQWQYLPSPATPDRPQPGPPSFGTDGSGPRSFRGLDDPLPAPLRTMRRVVFGPDLLNPTDRRGQPVHVEYPATVSMTSDRINRLATSGGMNRWADRLGTSVSPDDGQRHTWGADDWQKSHYFADQLQRWIHTDVTAEEAAARKWDAIRTALHSLLDPHYDGMPDSTGVEDPYFGHRTSHPGDPEMTRRLAEAYSASPSARRHAVIEVLRDLLDNPEFRRRAVDDLRLFRLADSELDALRQAVERVLAGREAPQIAPFVLPPPSPAED